ncbi:MAG: hypothetical protein WD793_10475 [Steroidobacteraceae bacterium]
MSASEQQAPLLRQRRFLILMSLATVAFYAFGIEPKNEATISGFGLTITQPDRLIIALWLVWGWSLWRYGQRVYELLSVVWDEIVDDVYAEDRRIALVRAKRFGNRLAAEGHFEEDMPKAARINGRVTIEPPDPDSLQSAIGEKITHFRDYIVTQEGGRLYPTLKADFEWEQGIKWGRTDHGFKMTLTRGESNWVRLRAWLHAFLRLPAFSEHIAPFLLALSAVLVWLVHRCVDS